MRSERRTVDTERSSSGIFPVSIHESETLRNREIDLIRSDRELAPDSAPNLHVNLRPIKGRFIRNLHVIYPRVLQYPANHVLGLDPKIRLSNELFSETVWIMRRETHQVLVDSEDLKVFQIHLIDC